MHLQDEAPPTPLKESWVGLIVHDPQEIKLFCQGALGIQLGICRSATAVVTNLALLRLGCGNHLVVAIQPSQAKLERCLGLQSPPLLY